MNKIPKKAIVHIDGGSRGNPGPSAVGVVICNEKGEVLKKYSHYLGDKLTNNEAEYNALIFALRKMKLIFGKKNIKNIEVEINSDSELLVKQMQGFYKIVSPEIQSLFLKAWNLKIDFKKIVFKLVPREENEVADKLVNDAFEEKERNQTLI